MATNVGSAEMLADERLTLCTKLSYGIGACPPSSTATVIGFFIAPFLLEVAQLKPTYVANIMLLGRVWDGITDPIIGVFIDRTKTRWGRLKPWIGPAVPFCAATYYCMWMIHPWLHTQAEKFGYYLLAYCAYQTAFTCYYVPYTALTMDLTDNLRERDLATLWRMSCDVACVLCTVIVQGFVVAGIEDNEAGYRLASMVIVVAFVLIPGFTVVAGVTRKENSSPVVVRLSVWEGFKVTCQSKAYLCLTMMYLLAWLHVVVVQSNMILYLKYALDAERYFDTVLATVMGSTCLSMPLWSWSMKRYGKRATYTTGVLVHSCILVALGFIPEEMPFEFFYPMGAVAGLGLSVCYLLPWSMLPDVVDEAELKTGVRQEAVFYAFFVFFSKLASGAALFLSTMALEVGGYVTAEEGQDQDDVEQPESVGQVLRMLVGPVPAVLLLLSLILCYMYPLTTDIVEENKRRLHNSGEKKSLLDDGEEDAKDEVRE